MWDINQGSLILDSSGQGPGDLRNIFGGNFSSPEPGRAFFRDDRAAGFTHFVEWQSASEIILNGYHLLAADDPNGNRGFTVFRLFVFDSDLDSFQLVSTLTPASNPYPNNVVNVSRTFSPVVAQVFRAEFDQFAPAPFSGPRIIELDAIGDDIFADGFEN